MIFKILGDSCCQRLSPTQIFLLSLLQYWAALLAVILIFLLVSENYRPRFETFDASLEIPKTFLINLHCMKNNGQFIGFKHAGFISEKQIFHDQEIVDLVGDWKVQMKNGGWVCSVDKQGCINTSHLLLERKKSWGGRFIYDLYPAFQIDLLTSRLRACEHNHRLLPNRVHSTYYIEHAPRINDELNEKDVEIVLIFKPTQNTSHPVPPSPQIQRGWNVFSWYYCLHPEGGGVNLPSKISLQARLTGSTRNKCL